MLHITKFFANWCQPCKAMNPIIEELKQENEDIVFNSVDIENNPQLRAEHFIRQIPTFIVFKNGIEMARKSGSMTKSAFQEWINELRNLQPEILPNESAGIPGAGNIVLRSTS